MPFNLPTTDLPKPTPAPFIDNSPHIRPQISNEQRILRDQLEKAWAEPLTNTQRKFVSALFGNGFSVAKAAKDADPSLSWAAAQRKGKYWYGLPAVQHAIEVAYSYFDETQKARYEDLVGELRIIATSSIMDFYEIDKRTGDPVLSMPKDGDPRLKAIAEISTEDTKFGVRSKVKLYDKLNAIDKLLKILDKDKGDESARGPGVVVQNINIIPVPAGQFLPAPTMETGPLLELTPLRERPLITVKQQAEDV